MIRGMKRSVRIALVAAVFAANCGGAEEPAPPQPSTPAPPSQTAAADKPAACRTQNALHLPHLLHLLHLPHLAHPLHLLHLLHPSHPNFPPLGQPTHVPTSRLERVLRRRRGAA